MAKKQEWHKYADARSTNLTQMCLCTIRLIESDVVFTMHGRELCMRWIIRGWPGPSTNGRLAPKTLHRDCITCPPALQVQLFSLTKTTMSSSTTSTTAFSAGTDKFKNYIDKSRVQYILRYILFSSCWCILDHYPMLSINQFFFVLILLFDIPLHEA